MLSDCTPSHLLCQVCSVTNNLLFLPALQNLGLFSAQIPDKRKEMTAVSSPFHIPKNFSFHKIILILLPEKQNEIFGLTLEIFR